MKKTNAKTKSKPVAKKKTNAKKPSRNTGAKSKTSTRAKKAVATKTKRTTVRTTKKDRPAKIELLPPVDIRPVVVPPIKVQPKTLYLVDVAVGTEHDQYHNMTVVLQKVGRAKDTFVMREVGVMGGSNKRRTVIVNGNCLREANLRLLFRIVDESMVTRKDDNYRERIECAEERLKAIDFLMPNGDMYFKYKKGTPLAEMEAYFNEKYPALEEN